MTPESQFFVVFLILFAANALLPTPVAPLTLTVLQADCRKGERYNREREREYGPHFVHIDVHYDKLHYKIQYLLRSTNITRNTIEDCAESYSSKRTESKLPSSEDLEAQKRLEIRTKEEERNKEESKEETNKINKIRSIRRKKIRKIRRRQEEDKKKRGKKERALLKHVW